MANAWRNKIDWPRDKLCFANKPQQRSEVKTSIEHKFSPYLQITLLFSATSTTRQHWADLVKKIQLNRQVKRKVRVLITLFMVGKGDQNPFSWVLLPTVCPACVFLLRKNLHMISNPLLQNMSFRPRVVPNFPSSDLFFGALDRACHERYFSLCSSDQTGNSRNRSFQKSENSFQFVLKCDMYKVKGKDCLPRDFNQNFSP